jgi:mannitol/fructose-specific phosphotransferase system IIA component (Ntr-type)
MALSDIFDIGLIKPNLASKTKEDAFRELVEAITELHPQLDSGIALQAILTRESKLNTSVAPGVAIPHGYYPGTSGIFGALGLSEAGIDYGAPDKKPVHCIFLVVMGEGAREKHLLVLNRIAALIHADGLELLRKAGTREEIHGILSRVH